MKYIYILLIPIFAFISCNQDEIDPITNSGYLSIGGIQLICDGQPVTVGTRAIPESLSIQILQGDQIIHDLPAPVAEEPLVLDPGEYQLRAYTDMLSEPLDSTEKGSPIYEGITPFEIKANELTLAEATATQVNLAIRVEVTDELILANFSTYTTTIATATRTVNIGNDDLNSYYFALPANGQLTYTMALTNSDNETFTTEPKTIVVNAKTQYTITPTIQ